jgi:3-isopropylmalate dehydrogenase
MGVAPSANVNPETGRGLFEPVHGSAPNLAGKGLVNPLGAILTAGMMVEHLGDGDAAKRIESAVIGAIKAGECTRDVGGSLSTREAADAVIGRLKD